MTQTTTPTLEARRDYLREFLDHGMHEVPSGIRRQIVDLCTASFLAEVHGKTDTAEAKYEQAVRVAAMYGLNIEAHGAHQ